MIVLILHGIGGYPGKHWQGWLANELEKQGQKVLMPALPEPDHPDRKEWLKVVTKTLTSVDHQQLVIVGHSLGVVTALDYLIASGQNILGFVSVGGFFEDYGAELNSYYMRQRAIDMSVVRSLIQEAYVYYGDDDPYVPQATLSSLAQGLGVSPRIIKAGGHLNTDSGYTSFPDLLDTIMDMTRDKTSLIDKLAYLHLQDKKVLVSLSVGKDTWYIPGGKREAGETDYQALSREVQEELSIELIKESIGYYGTFRAQAHGKPEGTIVRMTCYTGDYVGDLKASSEIAQLDYFGFSDINKVAPVDVLIMEDLKSKGFIT